MGILKIVFIIGVLYIAFKIAKLGMSILGKLCAGVVVLILLYAFYMSMFA